MTTPQPDGRAWLIAACVAMSLVAACSSRRPVAGTAADLRRLRVALDATAGLQRCRYSTGKPQVTIELGERANEQIEHALAEVFTTDDEDQAAPDMIAIPRIASVSARQEPGLGRVDATITYAVWFQTPAGEPITEVTGANHLQDLQQRNICHDRGVHGLRSLRRVQAERSSGGAVHELCRHGSEVTCRRDRPEEGDLDGAVKRQCG